jgi:hypothetical protein
MVFMIALRQVTRAVAALGVLLLATGCADGPPSHTPVPTETDPLRRCVQQQLADPHNAPTLQASNFVATFGAEWETQLTIVLPPTISISNCHGPISSLPVYVDDMKPAAAGGGSAVVAGKTGNTLDVRLFPDIVADNLTSPGKVTHTMSVIVDLAVPDPTGANPGTPVKATVFTGNQSYVIPTIKLPKLMLLFQGKGFDSTAGVAAIYDTADSIDYGPSDPNAATLQSQVLDPLDFVNKDSDNTPVTYKELDSAAKKAETAFQRQGYTGGAPATSGQIIDLQSLMFYLLPVVTADNQVSSVLSIGTTGTHTLYDKNDGTGEAVVIEEGGGDCAAITDLSAKPVPLDDHMCASHISYFDATGGGDFPFDFGGKAGSVVW